MIGMVVSNQRGGVGKTTTAVSYAGYLAARNKKVLLIDADSQGSVATVLGMKPQRFLSQFIVNRERLEECVTPLNEHLHVLASHRGTQEAEAALLGQMAREKALQMILGPEVEGRYDAVIIDVAPSVTLLQSCAMMFAGHVLIPVAMDLLSLQGAQMSVETVRLLNDFYKTEIRNGDPGEDVGKDGHSDPSRGPGGPERTPGIERTAGAVRLRSVEPGGRGLCGGVRENYSSL